MRPPLAAFMTRQLLGITPDADMRVALRPLAEAAVRHLSVMDGPRCRGVLAGSPNPWVLGPRKGWSHGVGVTNCPSRSGHAASGA